MTEVDSRPWRAFSAQANAFDLRPIEWVPADAPPPRLTPLQVQLDYFSKLLDSEAAGTLLVHWPAYLSLCEP
jgi:hypothetical protein